MHIMLIMLLRYNTSYFCGIWVTKVFAVCFHLFKVMSFQSIQKSTKSRNSETRWAVAQTIQDFAKLAQDKRQRNRVDK